jgi:hypothetical protein
MHAENTRIMGVGASVPGRPLIEGPPGSLGGAVSSRSVFNPQHLPGLATGSHWTVHVYSSTSPSP